MQNKLFNVDAELGKDANGAEMGELSERYT